MVAIADKTRLRVRKLHGNGQRGDDDLLYIYSFVSCFNDSQAELPRGLNDKTLQTLRCRSPHSIIMLAFQYASYTKATG